MDWTDKDRHFCRHQNSSTMATHSLCLGFFHVKEHDQSIFEVPLGVESIEEMDLCKYCNRTSPSTMPGKLEMCSCDGDNTSSYLSVLSK